MEPPDAGGFVGIAQPGFFYRVLQNADAFIVNPCGDGERMSVFSAVGEAEPGGIPEAGRCSVNHLADQTQGLDGSRSQSGGEQQGLEVGGPCLVCRGEDAAQTLQVDVGHGDIVAGGHRQVARSASAGKGVLRRASVRAIAFAARVGGASVFRREERAVFRNPGDGFDFPHQPLRAFPGEGEDRGTGDAGGFVRQIQDGAPVFPGDAGMRLLHKGFQILRTPVVAPGGFCRGIHPLLDDGPVAVIRKDEIVLVQLEAVLNRGVVRFRAEAARPDEGRRVESGAFPQIGELLRRPP